jgi:molybdenum cofactor biosynthesis protein B
MSDSEQSLSVDQHRALAPDVLRIAVLTVSDTRDHAEDSSGALIRDELAEAGHHVAASEIVRDEPGEIANQVLEWAARLDVDAVILTGGTGIAPRDRTPEALSAVFERTLDGFGEIFRMLSFQEIGSAAMLSRATAGTVNGKPVFALPGSRNAVRLAVERLILPEIGHIVFETRKGLTDKGQRE